MMSRYLNILFVTLIIILLGNYSCEPRWDLVQTNPCPSIDAIVSPKDHSMVLEEGRAGDSITLLGNFVDYDLLRDRITIGGIPGDPKDIFDNDTKMQFIVPAGITDSIVSIVVTINGCNSNAVDIGGKEFSLNYEKVSVTEINPVKAKHGDKIIISGTNFRGGDDFADNEVSFSGVAGIVKSNSTTELLVVEVPKGAKSGPITVKVDDFSAINMPEFTYVFTATVSLFAGTFNMPGPGPGGPTDSQLFDTPTGIAVFTSSSGETTIYVADTGNHVIRKIDTLGQVSLFAGIYSLAGGYSNPLSGPLNAEFMNPEGVVADSGGNVFVTESGNRTIRKINPNAGTVGSIGTIAGNPLSVGDIIDDRFGLFATFKEPHGITVVNDSLIYISDKLDRRIRIINTSTTYVSTLAGNGEIDCINGFSAPFGLTYDSTNDIAFVADLLCKKIQSITPSGNMQTIPGPGVIIPLDLQFSGPTDVTVDNDGNIYVSDAAGSNQIKRIDGSTNEVTLITTGASDGQPPFNQPLGIAYHIDTFGNHIIYVADTGNHVIRKIVLR